MKDLTSQELLKAVDRALEEAARTARQRRHLFLLKGQEKSVAGLAHPALQEDIVEFKTDDINP